MLDPTDVLIIPPNTSIVSQLRKLNLLFLLRLDWLTDSFLEINHLSLKDCIVVSKFSRTLLSYHSVVCLENSFATGLLAPHRLRSWDIFKLRASVLPIDLEVYLAGLDGTFGSLLEIGPGSGRIILELIKRWRGLKVDGIGKRCGEEDFYGHTSLERLAQILAQPDFTEHDRVNFHFSDISKGLVPFIEDSSYDFIYSMCSIRYIERKDVLLEEVFRLLKPGGIAILHLQLFNIVGKQLSDYINSDIQSECMIMDQNGFLMMSKTQVCFPKLNLNYRDDISYKEEWTSEKENKSTVGWNSFYEIQVK